MKNRAKKPDCLPLWIANIQRVELDSHGYSKVGRWYFGTGLNVYSFELRSDEGRTLQTEYVRAKTKHGVVSAAQKQWPGIQGVKRI